MQKREINTKLAPQPASAYCQAVEVTGSVRILYISGQLGMDTDGTTPSTMAGQARLAWRNVAAQLSEAGMGFDNLVKVTMIIPDAAEIPASRPACGSVGRSPPCQHPYRRRSRQSSLESRDRSHRMRLISSPLLLWFDQFI
jgi:enamine deaminase RidA (YjgF/YER057c/UK114 family)